MADIQSSDITRLQNNQGANQLYELKRGVIQMTPANFSGTSGFVQKEIYRISGSSAGSILLNSYDLYHFAQDPAAEFEGDEEITKLNYNFGTRKATATLWWRYYAGAPGYISVNFDIYYTAPGSSGSPYASDETQYFYYIVYSQQPIS